MRELWGNNRMDDKEPKRKKADLATRPLKQGQAGRNDGMIPGWGVVD